jgi:ribose transport system permease protein
MEREGLNTTVSPTEVRVDGKPQQRNVAAMSGEATVSRGDARGARDSSRGGTVETFLYRYMVVLVLAALIVLFSVLLPETFPTFSNLRTITGTQTVLIILTLGLTFPLAVGEFDLSFGAVLGFSSSLLAVMTVNHEWALGPAVALVFLAGATIGVINGFFVVALGVSSLITTLGTGTVIGGLTLAVSEQQVISGAPDVLVSVTTDELFGLPYPVYYGVLLAFAVWYLYEHTPIGRYIHFTGEGREVARLSGLRVDRIRFGAFMVVALMSTLAGVIELGTLGSADPNIGATFLLPAFAAAFLGATTIKPGRFNAWGTMVAVYVLVVGVTGLQLLGGAGWLEQVFNGTALVVAVTFAQLVRRRRAD